MGCQKWLHLCAPIFLTYFSRSRLCDSNLMKLFVSSINALIFIIVCAVYIDGNIYCKGQTISNGIFPKNETKSVHKIDPDCNLGSILWTMFGSFFLKVT